MITWSWGAFFVYLGTLVLVTLGGFIGLIETRHPFFLAPILMGLFFFYVAWEAVADDGAPPPPRGSKNHG
jgi:hypothetical protein